MLKGLASRAEAVTSGADLRCSPQILRIPSASDETDGISPDLHLAIPQLPEERDKRGTT